MSSVNNFDILGYNKLTNNDANFFSLCKEAGEIVTDFATGKIRSETKWKSKDGTIKQSVDVHRHAEIFRKIILSNPILGVVRDVFGDSPAFVNHSKISFKFSDQQVWYPHQDVAYKANKLNKGITICVHLEDVKNENGALVCYDKSHLGGFIEHELIFSNVEDEPQICIKDCSSYKKSVIEGKLGDILYFDFNTIHSSEGNKKGGCRPIFIFEVEKIQSIPLELDGSKSICFNYQYPSEIFILPARIRMFLRNKVIMPMLKNILKTVNSLNILPSIKIKK